MFKGYIFFYLFICFLGVSQRSFAQQKTINFSELETTENQMPSSFVPVVGHQFDKPEVGAHYRTEREPGSPAGQPQLGWWMRRMLSSTLNTR
jgi:hypothetical protein